MQVAVVRVDMTKLKQHVVLNLSRLRREKSRCEASRVRAIGAVCYAVYRPSHPHPRRDAPRPLPLRVRGFHIAAAAAACAVPPRYARSTFSSPPPTSCARFSYCRRRGGLRIPPEICPQHFLIPTHFIRTPVRNHFAMVQHV